MSERPQREPLESALAGLQPLASLLDRDQLMFAAGRAAAAPARRWFWPTSTAALLCLSLGLAAALAARPAPVETVRTVYVEKKPVAPTLDMPSAPPRSEAAEAMVADGTPPSTGADYLRMRRQVLRFGVESLPDSPPLSSSNAKLSIDSLIEPSKKRF